VSHSATMCNNRVVRWVWLMVAILLVPAFAHGAESDVESVKSLVSELYEIV